MKKINRITSVITLILSVILLAFIGLLNIIPIKYFVVILIVFLVMNIFNLFASFRLKFRKKGRVGLIILSLLLSLISIVGSFYLFKTILFMGNFNFKGYTTENYSVIVLKGSSYNKLESLENKKIGVLKNDKNEQKMLDNLNSNLKFITKEYDNILNMINELYNNSNDAIVIEDNYKSMLEEEITDFNEKVKTIYSFSIEYQVQDISKDVNVVKDTFTIYIAGIDTYGAVSSVARSDVNILATINPKTHQVLLTSIPRDSYVQLHGTTGYKDKLTHAGMYGVDMSVSTLEDLLDVDINYYVRVNFTSLINLVDALGGIDVYSEYSFNSNAGQSYKDGYHFLKGYNHVNGEQALAFARTRKAFSGGDRVRGQNQQAVIEALIRKAASPSIVTRYTALLDSLEGSFETNLSTDDITALARFQIDKMPSWNVTSIGLDGTDDTNYTYSFVGKKLYVMVPKEESIQETKQKINAIYNGEKLESSYGEVGNVKDPSKVDGVVKPQEPVEQPNTEDKTENIENESQNNSNEDESSDENSENVEDESNEILDDHLNDILGELIEEKPSETEKEISEEIG